MRFVDLCIFVQRNLRKEVRAVLTMNHRPSACGSGTFRAWAWGVHLHIRRDSHQVYFLLEPNVFSFPNENFLF